MQLLDVLKVEWADNFSVLFAEQGVQDFSGVQLLKSSAGVSFYGRPRTIVSQKRSILFREDPDGVFEPVQLYEETDYQVVVYLPFSKQDCLARKQQSSLETFPFLNARLADVLKVIASQFWIEESGRATTTIAGFFNAGAYVGTVNLLVYDDFHQCNVEVISAKIGYETEFKTLLSEIAQYHINLAFDVETLAGVPLQGTLENPPDLLTALFHLRQLMTATELPDAVETVIRMPMQLLRTEEGWSRPDEPIQPEPTQIVKHLSRMRWRRDGSLAGLFHGYTPERLPTGNRQETYDIPENRFVKAFLEELLNLLEQLQESCQREKRTRALQEIETWQSTVADWLSSDLWRDVGLLTAVPTNSQRLQRARGYRDIYRASIELREALRLPWNEPEDRRESSPIGSLKPIYKLYEYWCYFVVRSILTELFGTDLTGGKNLLIQRGNGVAMRLGNANDACRAVFKLPLPLQGQVLLFYNRKFPPEVESEWGEWSGSYSVEFDPDISIAVQANGLTHWVNFDAKYRLEKIWWNMPVKSSTDDQVDDREERRDFKQADLNKMHTYRDAILGTRGAYILFPGRPNEDNQILPYVRYKVPPNRKLDVPSVGALRLRPSANVEQRNYLRCFIETLVYKLAASGNYVEEQGLPKQQSEDSPQSQEFETEN
jgi:hypothetical protein